MPCNGDYMNPTDNEISASIVCSLLDELETGKLNFNHYKGYHPDCYTKILNYKEFTANVQKLCSILKTKDVSKYSLEMQKWWKEHKEADRIREEKEKRLDERKRKVDEVWSKLTNEEKEILSECWITNQEGEIAAVPKGFVIKTINGKIEIVYKL